MAVRRTPLTGKEVADIGIIIEQVAQGSENLSNRLQGVLMSSKRMSRGLEKDFRRIHRKLISDTRSLEGQIRRTIKAQKAGKKIDEEDLKNKAAKLEANKRQIEVLDRVNARTEAQSGLVSNLVARIKNLVSITGILNKIWNVLLRAFNNWVDLSQKTQQAMGEMAQQTGASAQQMQGLSRVANQMSGFMGTLEGDVDGIAMSFQHVAQAAVAWREVDEISRDFAQSILEVSRGFGMGVDSAVMLRRTLEALNITESTDDFRDFGGSMIRFAESIGANAGQLSRDMVESRAYMAQFGDQAVETFREGAIMATHFGFETRKIFDMVRGFDTFTEASQRVNQLNAVLGTSLSSFELMMEQNLPRRLEMIRTAVRNQGLEWGSLTRQQRMALAASVDLTEDEAARVFGQNISLQELREQQEEAARQQEKDALVQRNNQEMMQDLLRRTQTVFETIQRSFQRLWNSLSRLLAPIFEVINEELILLVDHFRNWIDEAGGTEGIRDVIKDISNWIRDVLKWVRESLPTWEELKEGAAEAWVEIQVRAEETWEILERGYDKIMEIVDSLDTSGITWQELGRIADYTLFLINAGLTTIEATLWVVKQVWDVTFGPMISLIEAVVHWSGRLYDKLFAVNDLASEWRTGIIAAVEFLLGPLGAVLSRLIGIREEVEAAVRRREPPQHTTEQQVVAERQREIARGQIRSQIQAGVGLQQLTTSLQRMMSPRALEQLTGGENLRRWLRGQYRELGVGIRGAGAAPVGERPILAAKAGVPGVPGPAGAPGAAPSAVETAPVTGPTRKVQTATVARGGKVVDVVASEVTLSGQRVGKVLFEVSQRT